VREVHEIASKYARRISLEGVVEVDEVYVHAGEKGEKEGDSRRRGLRKRGRGTWEGDKPPVLTIVKRGRAESSVLCDGEFEGDKGETERVDWRGGCAEH
jgi:hypothetical protein